MDKDSKKPLKDREPMVKRNEKGQLLPGSILNPDGYTKGNRNFETDFNEAVDEIAKENNMTLTDARKLLIKVAYKNAKDGVFQYHKDIHDRIYGQAKANVGLDASDDLKEYLLKLNKLLG